MDLPGSPDPTQEIEFASLIRCSSTTHGFDSDQRALKLEVDVRNTPTDITFAALPAMAQNGHFIAPPGYYMLHVVTTLRGSPLVRVPSVARFVRIQ